MTAYYNEHDPYAAEWLRNLIAAGHIAPGDVDERSIEDVRPGDLRGYAQCHFFAGIGVWSYALRRVGWRDDQRIWSGSCPCQPFSAAGKGNGFDDERHLWPAWFQLIAQCRPDRVVGEQVASKDGLAWLDLVHADMEAAGYAGGAVDLCAAGVGAPHIRQRLYLAYANESGSQGWPVLSERADCRPAEQGGMAGELEHAARVGREQRRTESGGWSVIGGCGIGGMGHTNSDRSGRIAGEIRSAQVGESGRGRGNAVEHASSIRGMAHPDGGHTGAERQQRGGEQRQLPQVGGVGGLADTEHDGGRPDQPQREPQGRTADGRYPAGLCGDEAAGPTNGMWSAADWLYCRDGKWRPVEPGTFPLAHGATARVGRLRAYGNAINEAQAEEFLRAFIDAAVNLQLG